MILIFTDGACSGNPGPGGWGSIVAFPDGKVLELGGFDGQTTNNRMELSATLFALRAIAERPEAIRLYTDSTYVIQGITTWILGWKRRGWKNSAGEPVLNRDLWMLLDAEAASRLGRLEWRYVRGHNGCQANERCDEIAVAFSKEDTPHLYHGPANGCDYSLAEPAAELLPKRSSGSARPKKIGGFYLSMVDGQVERHPSWPECQARVKGRSRALFKKVSSPEEEAETLKRWKGASN